ncbi:hypothetical protein CCP4SC76_3410001 [Gammaproteobacteria bacterium]
MAMKPDFHLNVMTTMSISRNLQQQVFKRDDIILVYCACTTNLGEARGYAMNVTNASGVIGATGLCNGTRSDTFIGGGLPPSPVVAHVSIDGKVETVLISATSISAGGCRGPLCAQKLDPKITSKRKIVYWQTGSD